MESIPALTSNGGTGESICCVSPLSLREVGSCDAGVLGAAVAYNRRVSVTYTPVDGCPTSRIHTPTLSAPMARM